jgi:hypothetical protein
MPGYVGFQLSAELTRFFPVDRSVNTGVTQLVNFARELRQSGSDIVVEEDLATIFGRGRICTALEQKFKAQINIQKYTPLCRGSELDLVEGIGPTTLRAFREEKYFATVLTLSMLSYFHAPAPLARIISKCITIWLAANVPGSPADPGFEGIMSTLMTCSSQTAAFQWSTYREEVERTIKQTMPDYYFQRNHTILPPALLAGAMNFLYLAQSLPEDRVVTVSDQTGCITIIIWAHFILGLSVVINTQDGSRAVVFGAQEAAQVHIAWSPPDEYDSESLSWDNDTTTTGPEIRLYDKDMSVILSCIPEEEDSLLNSDIAIERHPLRGYGVTYLRRTVNFRSIVDENHPVYGETVNMIVALALQASRKLDRNLYPIQGLTQQVSDVQVDAIVIEAWRVTNSARMIFHGMEVDTAGVRSYADFFGHNKLEEASLPVTVTALYRKTDDENDSLLPGFLNMVESLAKLILVFAHVVEVSECGDLPLILSDDHHWHNLAISEALETPTSRGLVNPGQIFDAVAVLISGPSVIPESLLGYRLCLSSGFGWSVFYDVVGFPDPSKCRPELVHIRRGTPMNRKTRETKFWIGDAKSTFVTSGHPLDCTVETGAQYVPRSIARVTRRIEYWSSQPREFELSHVLHLEPNADWQQFKPFKDSTKYRAMVLALWRALTSPPCNHHTTTFPTPSGLQESAKLGPDAVVFHGWDWSQVSPEQRLHRDMSFPHRILILLTFRQPGIRWLALSTAHGIRAQWGRQIMLRNEDCCVECALEYTVLKEGRWVLIL